MSVGENIRRYRKLRGMTQTQIAEAVGLTEGAVRHYESGIRAVKPELLESIADILGVSVNALKDYGVRHIDDEITMDYFAVSLPDLLIWDEDLQVKNRVHCLFMLALGEFGLGETEAARGHLREAMSADINHQGIKASSSIIL